MIASDSHYAVTWSSWRYRQLWVANAPGMPGTFFPTPRVSYPDMHYGKCVTNVPWCMLRSLSSGFLWSRWRGKRSRHSGACVARNFTYQVRGPCPGVDLNIIEGCTYGQHARVHASIMVTLNANTILVSFVKLNGVFVLHFLFVGNFQRINYGDASLLQNGKPMIKYFG